jgi:hypothetical protein
MIAKQNSVRAKTAETLMIDGIDNLEPMLRAYRELLKIKGAYSLNSKEQFM